MLKVGDYVRGAGTFPIVNGWIEPGKTYKVLKIREADNAFYLGEENGGWWGYRPNFELVVKCPLCGSDPCSCMEDEELDKRSTCSRCGAFTDMNRDDCEECGLTGLEALQNAVPTKQYTLKPLPARAFTSWPSNKMTAAILLNELD